MSALAQRTLLQHLTDVESIEVIVSEGLPDYVLPDEELRDVYNWAVSYYYDSGGAQPPSTDAMVQRWGDLLTQYDVDITDTPADTVWWAIDDLKQRYEHRIGQTFVRSLGRDLAEAPAEQRHEVMVEAASTLTGLVVAMGRQDLQADLREGMTHRLRAYERRAEEAGVTYGLTLGMDAIDEHTNGIHPGELAVLAGGPKSGKSYVLAHTALKFWERGKTPVLFTLENSVDMTIDRIACMATGVSPTRWQRGQCRDVEVKRVEEFAEQMAEADNPLWVIQPERGARTTSHMVHDAVLRGADGLLIDQLTFIEPPDETAPRYIQVRDTLHDLKELVSTARTPMPCLLAHQINREGMKAARKTGYLEMEHFAEGSEVERTADWGFALYRSHDDMMVGRAKWQTLGARRAVTKDWEIELNFETGTQRVLREVNLRT